MGTIRKTRRRVQRRSGVKGFRVGSTVYRPCTLLQNEKSRLKYAFPYTLLSLDDQGGAIIQGKDGATYHTSLATLLTARARRLRLEQLEREELAPAPPPTAHPNPTSPRLKPPRLPKRLGEGPENKTRHHGNVPSNREKFMVVVQQLIPQILTEDWMTEGEIRDKLERHLSQNAPRNIYLLLNRLTYKGLIEKGKKDGKSAWRKWMG